MTLTTLTKDERAVVVEPLLLTRMASRAPRDADERGLRALEAERLTRQATKEDSMTTIDLNIDEKVVLIGLLACMRDADGKVSYGEAIELLELQEELKQPHFADAVSRASVFDRFTLLDAAEALIRPEHREFVQTTLFDLSAADGERPVRERDLLTDLEQRWRRERRLGR